MDVDFTKVQSQLDSYPGHPVHTIESPYMNINFTDVAAKMVKEQDKAMEEYLVEYFGSVEEAIEWSKYFTLVVTELKFDKDTSVDTKEFKLTATSYFRVRVKTPEELKRSGVYEPWPEVIIVMQQVEAEREALIARDYDEALLKKAKK